MKSEPLVLCLTNTVAANFTANVLLAIGARPAMIEDPSEAAELAAAADAILVNVGTVTPVQADVMRAALRVAREKKIPWVLDPVAAHLLSYRKSLVTEFLASHPTILRGNHDEINFFRETEAAALKESIVLSTGEIDRIYAKDAVEPIEISGGVPLLQKVTATGCAQGGVCAALLGMGHTPLDTAKAASRLMKTAGERAFVRAKTPGSFQVALIDELKK